MHCLLWHPSQWAPVRATEVKNSMHLLYDGVDGVDGNQIRAVITEIRGDWKFQKEWLNLSHYYRCNTFCHCCYACVPDYGVVPSRLGNENRRGTEAFRAECLKPGPHSL